MIKSIPIPTAGVSLGLAALGNLLQPYSPLMKYTCGILAAILLAMLLIKILRYPKLVHADMTGNPILGSVAATFFMTTMQLCVYIKDFAPFLCEAIWLAAVAAHAILIIWFSKNFMLNLELKNVFPTFFIAYVGIVVASVTAPAFGYFTLGYYIFWFGFVAYMLLLALVTYRYLHHPIPEAAKPLICIYTAPMSLSLAGYFAVVPADYCHADSCSRAVLLYPQPDAPPFTSAVLSQLCSLHLPIRHHCLCPAFITGLLRTARCCSA